MCHDLSCDATCITRHKNTLRVRNSQAQSGPGFKGGHHRAPIIADMCHRRELHPGTQPWTDACRYICVNYPANLLQNVFGACDHMDLVLAICHCEKTRSGHGSLSEICWGQQQIVDHVLCAQEVADIPRVWQISTSSHVLTALCGFVKMLGQRAPVVNEAYYA